MSRGWMVAALGLAGCSFSAGPADPSTGDDAGIDAAPLCVTAPAGIVAWWDGEVVGEDIAGDADATAIRGNPVVDTGRVGSAVRFGADDIFEVDPAPTPETFTIEGWINLGAGDSEAWIGLYGRFQESSACLYQNRLTYWEGSAGGISGNLALGSAIDTGDWHHIAITWDGDTARTYLDGAIDGQQATDVDVALPSEVGVGGIFNGQRELRDPFVGLLDELTLYSRALAANEIASIASAGEAGKCK